MRCLLRSNNVLIAGIFFSSILFSCKPGNKPGTAENKFFDTVKIQSGLIHGNLNSSGDVRVFLGISYAAPPVGDLRWKAPQPPVHWNGVRECDHFGPVALQEDPRLHAAYSPEFLIDPEATRSEDCLYLNVWTAAKTADEKLPVLVWIHGGGFFSGSASIPVYDGESMAEHGIVFVNFNYRLGIFGFFAHPELTAEADYHASGNYALLDQIAALHWVKNNISAFGGDPENITIDGQSVGSMCVSYLMASPLTKGLFQRAIAESGPGIKQCSTCGLADLKDFEKKGIEYARSVNAKSLAELRNIPDSVLIRNSWKFLNAVVDGYVIPESVYNIFKEGKQKDVPLILGWNQGDGYIINPLKSAPDFKKQLESHYGKNTDNFLKIYPASSDEKAESSQLAYSRDAGFGAGNWSWASLHSRTSTSKVFIYYFKRKTPPASPDLAKFGAFHTANVVYELGNISKVSRPWEPEDRDLSGLMQSYWINFAVSGNPNGSNVSEWPSFDPGKGEVMIFNTNSGAAEHPDIAGIRLILQYLR